ncbi:MAG: LPS export ABC transporter permease LptG [Acetobacteraceae bacterium]|nr:LPS export ABC transporter permease LptG [Acetobacteraceae bacterium]
MRATPTLSFYVGRRYLWTALAAMGSLLFLVALFDLIELLRRAASKPEATFGILAQIVLLKVPFLATQILPFAVLLGGIAAFWRLSRASELVVARAAGVSAWQFLAPAVAIAIVFGMVAVGALTPLSSLFLARAERLDDQYLRAGAGRGMLAGSGLWLRQADHGSDPHGVAILHGARLSTEGGELKLSGVTLFRIGGDDRLVARIEAGEARLLPQRWELIDAHRLAADRPPEALGTITLPTDLTPARVQDSLASPESLSFWTLGPFIATLEAAGFSALRHRLHFQELLALPLLCGVMVLLGACFSMRQQRRGGVAAVIAAGIAAGFAFYLIAKVAVELGQSGALPVVLAAWAPTAAGMMFAVALLLHLEDG